MARSENRPSDFAELILLVVAGFRSTGANGVEIFEAIESIGRKSSVGAIYATLDRVEERGWIESKEVTDSKTGRTRRVFTITGLGEQALAEAERERTAVKAKFAHGF